MIRSGWLRFAALLLLALTSAGFGTGASAKQPAAADEPPLRFRRVFYPEDRSRELPLGRYLPKEPVEFERLVESAQNAAPSGTAASGLALVRGEYAARFVRPDCLVGQVKLSVAGEAGSRRLLPISPWNLALHGGASADGQQALALLGTGQDGKLQVEIDGPRELQLDWSLRGSSDANGVRVFSLEIPACPVASLQLDLPTDLTPMLSDGVVNSQEALDPAVTRWRINLGPVEHFELSLGSRTNVAGKQSTATVRQKTNYDITPRGLQLAADLELDVYDDPLRELELKFDSRLQILRIVDGDQQNVAWTIRAADRQGASRATLALNEPLLGVRQKITVLATMPVLTEEFWQLPGLSLPDHFWQQGDATVRIGSPLQIEDLVTEDCRQSKKALLPAAAGGEVVELQFFTPEPKIGLRLGRRTGQLTMSSGTRITLQRGDAIGSVTAELSVDQGEQFEIDAELLSGWNIESLDSIPTGDVADWTVISRDSRRRLKVRLARPLTPDAPVMIVVTGRRPRLALDERITVGNMAMWNVQQAVATRRLMSLSAPEPFQIRLVNGEDLTVITSAELVEQDRKLIGESPPGLLFEIRPEHQNVEVAVQDARLHFSAEIGVQAAIARGVLAETYRFRCVPSQTPVDRLRIRFSRVRPVSPHWILGGADGNSRDFTAKRLTSTSAVKRDQEGEVWELTFRNPQSGPFEFQAMRATPAADDEAVCLASIPDAANQSGILEVLAAPETKLSIVNRRLRPILAGGSPAESPLLRAAFRYDPQRESDSSTDPPLTVSLVGNGVQQPGAVVWRADIKTHLEPGGTSRISAAYSIQNLGSSRITIPMPPITRLLKLTVDAIDVSPRISEGRVDIPLPAGKPLVDVRLQWVWPTADWLLWGTYDVHAPTPTDVPVLARSSTVLLPHGLSPYEIGNLGSTNPSLSPLTISQRLFGPLGRGLNIRPWNPFTDNWRTILNSDGPSVAAANTTAGQGQFQTTPGPRSGVADDSNGLDTWAWDDYQLEGEAPSTQITVVNRGQFQAIGWAIGFIVAACTWWQSSRRITRVVWTVGLLATAALLAPEGLVPITSSAVLGALCGILAWIAVPAAQFEARPSVRRSLVGPIVKTAAVTIFAAGMFAGTELGKAQEPARGEATTATESAELAPATSSGPETAPSPTAGHSVHRVYIPVDDQERPTGGRYLVPESLWQQLMSVEMNASGVPNAWLIERATYRQSLSWEANSRRLQPDDLAVAYQLQVFHQPPRIQLPLGRLAGAVALDSLRLDGLPVDFTWEEEGQVLAFDAGEIGSHELEFRLRPTVRENGSSAGFDVPVLPIAASRYELSAPIGAPSLDVISAAGRVSLESGGSRLSAELGPTDRLAVRWRNAADPDAAPPILDAHELLWLKVQPNSVVLHARLLLNAAAGNVRGIELLADPRLRRLPLERNDPLISEVRGDLADSRRREIVFSRPIAGQEQIELKFLLTDATGVGILRLPQFATQGVRHRQRWLAVSVAPSLQAEPAAGEGLSALSAADFAAKWETSEEKPSLVYQLPDGEIDWRLSARTAEVRRLVDQVLTISAGDDVARVEFTANVETTGHCFLHRLSAPRGLVVDSVSVLEQGAERLSHWSRGADGQVSVFLSAPANVRQEMRLLGHVAAIDKAIELPRIVFDADVIRSDEVCIYRQPSALVGIESVRDLEEIVSTEPPRATDLGRLVHRLKVSGPRPAAQIAMLANRLDCQAEQVTSLHFVPDQDAWELQIDIHFQVKDGVVDEVRLAIPADWSGPHTLSSELPAELRHKAGRAPRLEISPTEPISGSAHFVLRGRWRPAQGAPLSVPAITLLENFRTTRYLSLPTLAGSERLTWETEGLQSEAIPALLGSASAKDDGSQRDMREAFRITRDDFRAVKTQAPADDEFPEVTLADYRVALCRDRWLAVATLDVTPGDLSNCELAIPADCTIAECWVAGRPAVMTAQNPRLWRLDLGAQRLPQRLELVFFGTVLANVPDGGRAVLQVPRLRDLPVRRTLWTVTSPTGWEPVISTARSATRWDLERIRLQSAVTAVTDAASIAIEEPIADAQAWYLHWVRPITESRDSLRRTLVDGRTSAPRRQINDIVQSTQDQQTALESRLELTPASITLAGARFQPTELWDLATNNEAQTGRWVVPGESVSVTMLRHNRAAKDMAIRFAAASCLLLGTAVSGAAIRRGLARNWILRWPRTLLVICGLGWWLWLSPSALGWLWLALIPLLASRPKNGLP